MEWIVETKQSAAKTCEFLLRKRESRVEGGRVCQLLPCLLSCGSVFWSMPCGRGDVCHMIGLKEHLDLVPLKKNTYRLLGAYAGDYMGAYVGMWQQHDFQLTIPGPMRN